VAKKKSCENIRQVRNAAKRKEGALENRGKKKGEGIWRGKSSLR
jgi:hypothetical protein